VEWVIQPDPDRRRDFLRKKMQLDPNSWPPRGASTSNRTDQLFYELRQLIEHSGASTPVRDHDSVLYPPIGYFSSSRMPPKKSGRALLREEGGCNTSAISYHDITY
jgi:hypothetical protein